MNGVKKICKQDWFVIGILLTIAVFLRFYKLCEHSIWFDEYVVIGNAKFFNICDYLSLLYINSPDYGISPASAIILYYWINLFPEIDWLWRILPITVGLFAITVTYYLAKCVLGRRIAILSCLLFCFSPFNIWFHQELKCYAFLQFLSILSFYAMYKYFYLKDKNYYVWLFVSFLSNMVMPWFHAVYILTPLLQIPIVIVSFYKFALRKKILWFFIAVLSIFPWLIFYIKMSPFLFNTMDTWEGKENLWIILRRLLGIDSVGMSEELLPVWKTNVTSIENPILGLIIKKIEILDYFVLLLFYVAILLFGVNVLWQICKKREKVNQGYLFIFMSFIVPISVFLVIELITKKPVFHPLYLLYALPFLYIITSSVISGINLGLIKKVSIFILILVYLFQCFSFTSFQNRTNHKEATKYIEENAGLNDIILGQRVITFWDINKIYMKRNDLQYQSYYSLFGALENAREFIEKGKRNHVWIIMEQYTLQVLYQSNPVAKLDECFHNNGYEILWKVLPGHYNLYIGYITKNISTYEENVCRTLINSSNVNYEGIIKELNMTSPNESENKKNRYTLQRYISHWPILSWINIFIIAELIKEGDYFIAEKLCDYLLSKYPQFWDIYLLKSIICFERKDYRCEEKYINVCRKKSKVLMNFINKIRITRERRVKEDNKYAQEYLYNINKRGLFPLNHAINYYK